MVKYDSLCGTAWDMYRLNNNKNAVKLVTNILVWNIWFYVWFGSLRPSQQLWSCRDGQFT